MEVVEVAGGLRFLSRIEGGKLRFLDQHRFKDKKGGVTFHPAHLILIEVVESICFFDDVYGKTSGRYLLYTPEN